VGMHALVITSAQGIRREGGVITLATPH